MKSPYLKPSSKSHISNYAKYIATREGVEMLPDSKKHLEATGEQKNIIEELLKCYPDSAELYEFEDYEAKPTRSNADEFIMRASELHGEIIGDRQKYVDYIATRPRAEKLSQHGLFTDDGVPVVLEQVARKVAEHKGNIWTHIISLRREDAERLGYNNAAEWQTLLQSQRNMIAQQMKISPENFRWYAAFHNEGHHPHVHMMAYSVNPNEPYLSKKGIENIKSSLARQLFRQDLISVYREQTESRDALREDGRKAIAEIVAKINSGDYDNPYLSEMMIELSERISEVSGSKSYGYQTKSIKALVNRIVDELEKEDHISRLYDLWYEHRFGVLRTYSDTVPEKLPLSQNDEFKAIRNAVIREAMNIKRGLPELENVETESDVKILLPDDDEVTEPQEPVQGEYERLLRKTQKNMWDEYHLAKLCLDSESGHTNISEAVMWLIESSKHGCSVAQYKLGRLFLLGEEVIQDVGFGLRWLEESAKGENSYAQYLLGKEYLLGDIIPQDTEKAVSLLERAAEHENLYAQYTLGKLYLDGSTVALDTEKGLALLTASADKGFEAAEYKLGKLLLGGDAIPADINRATEYITKAASKGNRYAQYALGKLYLSDEHRDINKALRYLKASAMQDNEYAEYLLGKLYLFGSGVEKDSKKALAYLNDAASHGNIYAESLIKSVNNGRNAAVGIGLLRLFGSVGRIFQNKAEEASRGGKGRLDRKQKRKLDEKKQAQGLKIE